MNNALFRWYDSSEIESCVILVRMLLFSIILIRIVEFMAGRAQLQYLICMSLVARETLRPYLQR